MSPRKNKEKKMNVNVNEIAENWILENSNNSDFASHEEFVLALAADFEAAASHIGDCFADTAWWADESGVDQGELEAAIVDLVFAEAEEIKRQSQDD